MGLETDNTGGSQITWHELSDSTQWITVMEQIVALSPQTKCSKHHSSLKCLQIKVESLDFYVCVQSKTQDTKFPPENN